MQKKSRKHAVILQELYLKLKNFFIFLLRVWDELKFGRIFILGARGITRSS